MRMAFMMAMLRKFGLLARTPFLSSLVRSQLTDKPNIYTTSLGSLRDCMVCTEPSVTVGVDTTAPSLQRSLSLLSQRLNRMNCLYRKKWSERSNNNRDGSNFSLLKSPTNLSKLLIRSNSNCVNGLIECSGKAIENHVHTGDFQIIEDFISIQEHDVLLEEIERHFKGARYEYDHWDDAIHGYRETEKSKWSEETQNILQRVRDEAFEPEATQLPLVHVLDLAGDGYIKPHVDSVKFCGPTIAGLSLISSSVARLIDEKDNTLWLKALLPPGSLYIIRNTMRYDYTHEILKDGESVFHGRKIRRGRRVSVMFRDHPTDMDGLQ